MKATIFGTRGSFWVQSVSYLCYENNCSWTQIGIVQGGIRDCGDPDYPGLYIRVDDPEVLNFIFDKTGKEADTGLLN